MYASAKSVSALLPLCVMPLQKLILRISLKYIRDVPALWEPALISIDIDQTSNHLRLRLRNKNVIQWMRETEGIPDTVKGIECRFSSIPKWILSRVILG